MQKYHITAEQAVEVAFSPELEARLIVPGQECYTCEFCGDFAGSYQNVCIHEASCASRPGSAPRLEWCDELRSYVEDID